MDGLLKRKKQTGLQKKEAKDHDTTSARKWISKKKKPTAWITKKKKQGYKAREDESLGMRRGKESGKKQSMKARRDESYGAWGKRKPKFGRKNKVNK